MTAIAIKTRELNLDDDARAQIIQQGHNLFSRVNFWVRQIELILEKQIGPDGEQVKCTVRVVGQDATTMVVEHIQSNAPGAAITALRRAYHKFSQMKKRQRIFGRRFSQLQPEYGSSEQRDQAADSSSNPES